jgi:hypothetical protein
MQISFNVTATVPSGQSQKIVWLIAGNLNSYNEKVTRGRQILVSTCKAPRFVANSGMLLHPNLQKYKA